MIFLENKKNKMQNGNFSKDGKEFIFTEMNISALL
jgi:hypothetical protein